MPKLMTHSSLFYKCSLSFLPRFSFKSNHGSIVVLMCCSWRFHCLAMELPSDVSRTFSFSIFKVWIHFHGFSARVSICHFSATSVSTLFFQRPFLPIAFYSFAIWMSPLIPPFLSPRLHRWCRRFVPWFRVAKLRYLFGASGFFPVPGVKDFVSYPSIRFFSIWLSSERFYQKHLSELLFLQDVTLKVSACTVFCFCSHRLPNSWLLIFLYCIVRKFFVAIVSALLLLLLQPEIASCNESHFFYSHFPTTRLSYPWEVGCVLANAP